MTDQPGRLTALEDGKSVYAQRSSWGTARTAIVMGVEIFGWFRFEVFLRRNELAGLDGLSG